MFLLSICSLVLGVVFVVWSTCKVAVGPKFHFKGTRLAGDGGPKQHLPSFDTQIYKASPPLSDNCDKGNLVRCSTVRRDPCSFMDGFVGENTTTND